MPNVLIREVPPEVHQKLAQRAASQGRSLQTYLQMELARLARLATVEEIFDEIERTAEPQSGSIDAVETLDEVRAERDAQIETWITKRP